LVLHRYRIAGLSVSSEVALPGLISSAGDERPPDVTILQDAAGPPGAASPSDLVLRIPEVGNFRLRAGREIAFEAEKGISVEDLVPYLAGSVFGTLLHQRGLVTFHASAMRVGDRAVLFCGSSGAGKSTLAAALGQRGYALVADDLCAVELRETPMVQPDARQLRLWADAVESLSLTGRRGASVHRRYAKHFVAPTASSNEPLAIGAVYLLRQSAAPQASSIEPLNPVDAVALLIENAYRPDLMKEMGQRGPYFTAAATIANAAGTFLLTRPQDLAALPETAVRLERHWAGIGLLARAACRKTV